MYWFAPVVSKGRNGDPVARSRCELCIVSMLRVFRFENVVGIRLKRSENNAGEFVPPCLSIASICDIGGKPAKLTPIGCVEFSAGLPPVTLL